MPRLTIHKVIRSKHYLGQMLEVIAPFKISAVSASRGPKEGYFSVSCTFDTEEDKNLALAALREEPNIVF